MFSSEDEINTYSTIPEAQAEAQRLGGSGYHSHTDDDTGITTYMPFATHEQFELATGVTTQENEEFKNDMRDKIRMRLTQLLSATTTNGGF